MLRTTATRASSGFFRRAPATVLRSVTGDVRSAGGSYAEKERTLENIAVSQKDAELLKKLRDTLKLQEGQTIPESVVADIGKKAEERKQTLAKKWRIPKEESLV